MFQSYLFFREYSVSTVSYTHLDVYKRQPLVECEKRDVKGLYAKARRGEIKNFTGISAPFAAPEHPALSLDTSKLSLEESVNTVLELVLPIVCLLYTSTYGALFVAILVLLYILHYLVTGEFTF